MAGYHTHSLDQISVLVADADMVGQVLGEQPAPARRNPRGNVGFTEYSKKALTHKVIQCRPDAVQQRRHHTRLSAARPVHAGLAL